MKTKTLNALLFLTSLIGYLEWGTDNKSFIFQMEIEIIIKLFSDVFSVVHPLVLLPILGQILLLFTLFQKKITKKLTAIGILGIGALFLILFIVGVLNINFKIIISTLPFFIISFLSIKDIVKQG